MCYLFVLIFQGVDGFGLLVDFFDQVPGIGELILTLAAWLDKRGGQFGPDTGGSA